MKKLLILKSFIIISIAALSWSDVITKVSQSYESYFSSNFDIVSDAIEGIQKTLIIQTNGKPYLIRRTYNIGEKEVSITTKTHFKEYRKKPSYNKEVINISNTNDSGSVIEFVYKSSNKNHITRINKKTKRKDSKKQKIDFNFDPEQEKYLNPIDIFANLVKI